MPTEIKVNSPKTGKPDPNEPEKIIPRSVTVEYDFGKDVEAAVQMFGAEVVHSKFVQQCATDLGNSIRRILNDPANGEKECEEFVSKYKPGVVTPGRKKQPTTAELVAELKNPETTQERKIEIAGILKAQLATLNEAETLINKAAK